MNVAQTGYSLGEQRGWEFELTLNSPGMSDWIIIPEKINNISVTLDFSGGSSGYVQTTTNRVDTVLNGSPVAIDWPFGIINVKQSEKCKPATAIRAVQVNSGQLSMSVRSQ